MIITPVFVTVSFTSKYTGLISGKIGIISGKIGKYFEHCQKAKSVEKVADYETSQSDLSERS